jgi:ribosomal protein L11 methyltransferase
MKSFFVAIRLPEGMSAEAREPLSQILTRVASRFSFQGLEDWTVDVKNSRVLGAEAEFRDLTRAGKLSDEMRVYFGRERDARLFAAILRASFQDLRIGNPRRLAPRDWMKAWRKHYRTQVLRVGTQKLAIVPAWKKAPAYPHVRITPGQAFGTGTHPTTQLCLKLLLRFGADKRRVLDFGAGTGVLLIAAQKLSGAKGVAVESDPTALAQARKNARLNRASGLGFTRALPRGKFDLVFANVLAPVLLEQRARLHAALAKEGVIFLSGILKSEAPAFERAFRGKLRKLAREDQGDWCAFAFTP